MVPMKACRPVLPIVMCLQGQRSVVGFLPKWMCVILITQLPVLVSSSSDVDAHVTGDDDDDIPSAKKVCVYIFCDKWAKDRP